MKFFRIFPEMWASTWCPFGKATRNIVPGSTCVIDPTSSIGSSLATELNQKVLLYSCHLSAAKSMAIVFRKVNNLSPGRAVALTQRTFLQSGIGEERVVNKL
jgi:hypothetical protein